MESYAIKAEKRGDGIIKSFCSVGPVNFSEHYFVPRISLVEAALKKIDEGKFFSVIAQKNQGKTTFLKLLIEKVNSERKKILPVFINFENFGNVSPTEFLFLINRQFEESLGTTLKIPEAIQLFDEYLKKIMNSQKQEIAIFIDSMEGLENSDILNTFIRTVRRIESRKIELKIRSVVFAGVLDSLKRTQEDSDFFKIEERLDMPNFTFDETKDLIFQHEKDTNKKVAPEVVRIIFENTMGQPVLVNSLAKELTGNRYGSPEKIPSDNLNVAIQNFIENNNTFFMQNIVSNVKNYSNIIKPILFGKEISFNLYDESLNFLYENGLINNNCGICAITVPLYKKALYYTYKPLQNDEKENFKNPNESFKNFLDNPDTFNMNTLIKRFARYLSKRSQIVLNPSGFYEGIYHYTLDAFLSTYSRYVKARVLPEILPDNNGVGFAIYNKGKSFFLSLYKYDCDEFEENKEKCLNLLKKGVFDEWYLIFFSESHKIEEYFYELVSGKVMNIWILPFHNKNIESMR